ncbi:hypothetical protein AB0H71_29745 [Nocardia sp. NPDC050697]|uniref:hypothetical protein n=1 Tax=Nocardia sp. NPDC050697 TaxID=3155158 RepID=UPI0033C6A49C
MSAGSVSVWPVVWPVTVAAMLSTGLAVSVNLATGGGPWWMWLLVAGLTVAGIATSVWQYRRQMTATSPEPEPGQVAASMQAAGPRSVVVGRDAGSIRTGDDHAPATPSASPVPPPRDPAPQDPAEASASPDDGRAPGSVSATGERSVAVGRDAGTISTGDRRPGPSTS